MPRPAKHQPTAEIQMPHFALSPIHAKPMKDIVIMTNNVTRVCDVDKEIVDLPWVMPITLIAAMSSAMIGWISKMEF